MGMGDALTGVVGRLEDALPDVIGSDSRETLGGLRAKRTSSPRSNVPSPRGGERGESIVKVGASCGDE
jgi:hypothetical protein